MTTRQEKRDGQLASGEMNGKRLSEELGVAHGTIKRWLHDGMPAIRDRGDGHVWIDPDAARAWLAERFKGRKTIAFNRQSFVYVAEREDGAIKIGWSSDVMRRIQEMRKDSTAAVQLLACFPGDKPDELRLHDRFAASRIEFEWYRPDEEVQAFIDGLRERAA